MAQELSESEAIQVVAFGLDRPEDSNPEVGPRCGACRLGLVVHESRDPQCVYAEERARLMSDTPTNEAREKLVRELVKVIEGDYDRSSGPEEAWSVEGLAIRLADALPSLGYVKPEPGEWDELLAVAGMLNLHSGPGEGNDARLKLAAALRQEVAARQQAEAELAALQERVEAVTELVKDTDGDWLDGSSFEGLAGAIQEAIGATTLTASPTEEPKP